MGTWGEGNLDNDNALDELYERSTTLIDDLLDRARSKTSREADEADYATLFVEFELVFALDAHKLFARRVLPEPEELATLKRDYVTDWDAYIDGLEPAPGFKAKRRAVIEGSFDRLIGMAEQPDGDSADEVDRGDDEDERAEIVSAEVAEAQLLGDDPQTDDADDEASPGERADMDEGEADVADGEGTSSTAENDRTETDDSVGAPSDVDTDNELSEADEPDADQEAVRSGAGENGLSEGDADEHPEASLDNDGEEPEDPAEAGSTSPHTGTNATSVLDNASAIPGETDDDRDP